MVEEQVSRLWIVLALASLVLLFVGAWTKKIVVYRDYSDLGLSVGIVCIPIIGSVISIFICGDETDISVFVTEMIVGQVIAGLTLISMFFCAGRSYLLSIRDNGLFVGLLVGTLKIYVAVLVTICSVGLLQYLFRDNRKLGHVAIFFMIFAVFGWFINVLVNGDKLRKLEEEM